jgi:hypothetical protein
MTLTPRKKRQPLLKRVDQIHQVYIEMPDHTHWRAVLAVGLETMADLHNEQAGKIGLPTLYATENGEALIFHPIPDKKYKCRVVGTITVEQ